MMNVSFAYRVIWILCVMWMFIISLEVLSFCIMLRMRVACIKTRVTWNDNHTKQLYRHEQKSYLREISLKILDKTLNILHQNGKDIIITLQLILCEIFCLFFSYNGNPWTGRKLNMLVFQCNISCVYINQTLLSRIFYFTFFYSIVSYLKVFIFE